jgi:hypothetical protein|tara:strand:- start:5278 stop:5511 length:234 start_codon:yes stop_codon:yes gene_type:complete
METNVGIRTYNQIESLAKELKNNASAEATPTNGLLSPPKRKMKDMGGAEENPAYRVATYFNTIRDKRMERLNGRTTV